jgi:hypothetical protein
MRCLTEAYRDERREELLQEPLSRQDARDAMNTETNNE